MGWQHKGGRSARIGVLCITCLWLMSGVIIGASGYFVAGLLDRALVEGCDVGAGLDNKYAY